MAANTGGQGELVGRFSTLDLTDGAIDGGEMAVISVGLNWYLNAHTRMMTDFVRASVSGSETLAGVQTRFQIDF
ncbi:MAG: porin [Gemmatimonadales bacterium]